MTHTILWLLKFGYRNSKNLKHREFYLRLELPLRPLYFEFIIGYRERKGYGE